VPYSQQYLFNTIAHTNHNVNPTNADHNSKGNFNHTNTTKPTNPYTRYQCEYGTLNSMFAKKLWCLLVKVLGLGLG